MKIRLSLSALGRSRWYEYLSRFIFGGIATVMAGIVADKCGPAIGGMFLAFPAIFPASATLIESHEREKNRLGQGTVRGRKAAALDAAGAAAGSFGLMMFGLVVWKLIVSLPLWATLILATVAWLATSLGAWRIWKAQ